MFSDHCRAVGWGVIELAGLMMLTRLAQSSLHCTSRRPYHGSHSTSSLPDAPQNAFDCTEDLRQETMALVTRNDRQ